MQYFSSLISSLSYFGHHGFFVTYIYLVGCWVTSHQIKRGPTPIQQSQCMHAYHRKYMMLSFYMFTAWFYSIFVQPLLENMHQHKPTVSKHMDPPDPNLNDELIRATDEGNAPRVTRTPLQNKILLHTLEGLQAPRPAP